MALRGIMFDVYSGKWMLTFRENVATQYWRLSHMILTL